MKIVTVIGARPQFVKAAVLSHKIRELTDWEEVIVHTGQHYDNVMSNVFFEEMGIPKPDYQLNVGSASHGVMTGEMLMGIERILQDECPDWVLVYGDTNSTLAGALASSKLNIPLAHVEAGLRSFNRLMPEELNRIITDRLSQKLFVPSVSSTKNLNKEGITVGIHEVGDIMYDAVVRYSNISGKKAQLASQFKGKPYVLLTLHRQENTDSKEILQELVEAINQVSKEVKVVFPVHPRTKKQLNLYGIRCDAQLIEPVGYFDMLELIKHSKLVMTDSGGLQKEAYYLNKYCVTLRQETEWTELVEAGVNKLAGSQKDAIVSAARELLRCSEMHSQNIYGDGSTAEKIITSLSS